uniref:Uncharacterized protein n=1 Tax=Lepeophtheirus salmonis TaxID=72036 RepID=A0A0K2V1C0_LEPSM
MACSVRSFEDVDFLKIHLAVRALIGIQLIEPFLLMTTSTNMGYNKLILRMKELYNDLKTTNSIDLLNISSPAFKFTTLESFSIL